MNNLDIVVDLLNKKFCKNIVCSFSKINELTVEVKDFLLVDLCYFLRNNSYCKFEQLIDLCGVDYLFYGLDNWYNNNCNNFNRAISDFDIKTLSNSRFAVVYHLLSIEHNHRIRLKVFVDNNDLIIPSIVNIWPSANWYEREAFDLFGIVFLGHPDLRRILTDYGFKDHPLRKDFPLEGKVEIYYDNKKGEIVYEPVSISNRYLIPKVIRA
ncbi:MAG: NADH-quinone oxidoreductase subunit C [Candidatus Azosocius agrarius]|nr:MAG: NADH-quinone oxidoreductase subunit C [Gammaproteobacteria bacterium]